MSFCGDKCILAFRCHISKHYCSSGVCVWLCAHCCAMSFHLRVITLNCWLVLTSFYLYPKTFFNVLVGFLYSSKSRIFSNTVVRFNVKVIARLMSE